MTTNNSVEKEEKASPLKPSTTLLCKLGSIIIHAEEGLSNDGHAFDITTLKSLIKDAEVSEWLKQMDDLALIPKKRKS